MPVIRAPVIPKGCPTAIDPPWGLSFSKSTPSSRAEGITWAAKASLISTMSMSSIVMPAWSSACFEASMGPSPMISGFSADTPVATIRADGSIPSSSAFVSLITTTAAAPSFSGQALPAVTRPSGRKTGWSSAIFSRSLLGRGESSSDMVPPFGSSTGVISFSQKPSAFALA